MTTELTPSVVIPTDGAPEQPNHEFRRSALVAGIGILALAVLAGVANFGVVEGLVTRNEPVTTARDILASQALFRFGIIALLVVAVLDVIVAWALLTFFAPVNSALSTLAAWLRALYAAIFAVAVTQLMGVLPLLTNVHYLTTSNAGQRQSEGLAKIQAFHDMWNVSLVFFALHLLLIGYLAFRSGYVPRFIGVLVAIAGAGYLIDSAGGILTANSSLKVSSVTFIGEAVLMVWLLVKGRALTPKETT